MIGGSNLLNLYFRETVPPPSPPANISGLVTPLGCFTEATSSRALASANAFNTLMTVEVCQSLCADYTFFGVELLVTLVKFLTIVLTDSAEMSATVEIHLLQVNLERNDREILNRVNF
jgi:hypothetical protein